MSPPSLSERVEAAWQWLLSATKLAPAFPVIASGQERFQTYTALLSSAGMGAMSPKTIMMGLGAAHANGDPAQHFMDVVNSLSDANPSPIKEESVWRGYTNVMFSVKQPKV